MPSQGICNLHSHTGIYRQRNLQLSLRTVYNSLWKTSYFSITKKSSKFFLNCCSRWSTACNLAYRLITVNLTFFHTFLFFTVEHSKRHYTIVCYKYISIPPKLQLFVDVFTPKFIFLTVNSTVKPTVGPISASSAVCLDYANCRPTIMTSLRH